MPLSPRARLCMSPSQWLLPDDACHGNALDCSNPNSNSSILFQRRLILALVSPLEGETYDDTLVEAVRYNNTEAVAETCNNMYEVEEEATCNNMVRKEAEAIYSSTEEATVVREEEEIYSNMAEEAMEKAVEVICTRMAKREAVAICTRMAEREAVAVCTHVAEWEIVREGEVICSREIPPQAEAEAVAEICIRIPVVEDDGMGRVAEEIRTRMAAEEKRRVLFCSEKEM